MVEVFCGFTYSMYNKLTCCSVLFPTLHRIFRLNMYTAPAYFMSCVILTTIILMRIYTAQAFPAGDPDGDAVRGCPEDTAGRVV